MFVPDEIWVTANFKETRLDAMRPDHAPAELDAERMVAQISTPAAPLHPAAAAVYKELSLIK
jgi:multidrug resistance efflux pump